VAWNLEEEQAFEWTTSHARLSDFLDALTCEHALHGGALYSGYSAERVQEARQIQWLEDHWHKACVSTTVFEGTLYALTRPTVYIREGQAVCWNFNWWNAATNPAEGLAEIAQALQITWEEPDDKFDQML
jgi:hypothetical protein